MGRKWVSRWVERGENGGVSCGEHWFSFGKYKMKRWMEFKFKYLLLI
jgi:hypothetical protein